MIRLPVFCIFWLRSGEFFIGCDKMKINGFIPELLENFSRKSRGCRETHPCLLIQKRGITHRVF